MWKLHLCCEQVILFVIRVWEAFCYKKGPIDNTLFEVNETLSESIMEIYYRTPEITVLVTCYRLDCLLNLLCQ